MTGNLENVGYAREGKYGVYNILIMEEVQTIINIVKAHIPSQEKRFFYLLYRMSSSDEL